MQKIEALLFDLDGTIVDNMGYHVQAWAEYLRSYGIEDSLENVNQRVSGKTTEEVIRMYFGDDLSPDQIKDHYQKKESYYKKIYLPHLKENPGITKLLDQARQLNIPAAIASAAGIDNVAFVINNLKIAGYFKTIVSAADVSCGKPDPEIFLLAAKRLGVHPSSCLVFEDALAGLEGAQNAGMKAIAITTAHTAEKLSKYPAVIKVVDNFLDLDLKTIINY